MAPRQDKKAKGKVPGLRAPEPQKKKFGLKIEMPRFDEPTEAEQLARAVQSSVAPSLTSDVPSTPNVRSTPDVWPAAPTAPETTSEIAAADHTLNVLRTADVPSTADVPRTERTVPTVQNVRGTSRVPRTPRVLVEHKDGHLQVPHWLSDNLLPQLDPLEQVLYYRLYRLSHGFGNDECTISTPTLERITKIKHTALFTTLKKLEDRGLIERVKAVVAGNKGGQGNLYRVHLPALSDATVDSTRGVRRTSRVPRTPNVPSTPSGYNKEKDLKESIKGAPDAIAPAIDVFQIRTIGARLLEAHKSEADFDQEKLRSLVLDALLAQGQSADDATIDEAIRGMAGA